MRRLALALLLAPLAVAPALAQDVRQGVPLEVTVRSYTDVGDRGRQSQLLFDPALRPFYHGVASGDPTATGVVLWTRVTPPTDTEVAVRWRIATDPAFRDVVQSGTARTDGMLDYTVRVEVEGLDAGRTYYYGFTALGANSITGRTRTAPSEAVDQLRFAVTSCSNYQQGYFVAYRGVAARADLDAVLHLGDYFYEYGAGVYGDRALVSADRAHVPLEETVSLEDYRIRHSLYKLDPDLRAAHQQHPWITVWDDHETANDSWEGGAQNHNEFLGLSAAGDSLFADEGLWASRKGDAQRAYFEWIPLRRPEPRTESGRIYRRLSYGPLAEVRMLDTRLQGRMEQLATKTDAAAGTVAVDTTRWLDPDRTLLGAAQRDWLLGGLAASAATWKVLGNQVMMTQLAFNPFAAGRNAPFTNLDAWDGYPAERTRLLTAIRDGGVDNVVVTTGDIHTTWASDLPLQPFGGYDPATGAGSVAVEFVTPSVTAANLNENQGIPPEQVPEDTPTASERGLAAAYPQLKTVELDEHGYFVLDLTPARAQADWFYVDDVRRQDSGERFSRAFFTAAGDNHLQAAPAPAPGKASPPALAPAAPPALSVADEAGPDAEAALLIVGAYPNPTRGRAHLAYVLNAPRAVRADVVDVQGRAVAVLLEAEQAPGAYALDFDTAALAPGVYVLRLSDGQTTMTRRLSVVR